MNRYLNQLYTALFLMVLTVPAIAFECVSHDYQVYIGIGLERSFTSGKQTPSQTVANLSLGQPTMGVVSVAPGQYQSYLDGRSVLVGFNLRNIGLEFGYTRFDNIYYPVLYYTTLLPQNTPVTGKQTGSNVFLQGVAYFRLYRNFIARAIIGSGYLTTKYTVIINGMNLVNSTTTMNGQFKPKFSAENFGLRIGGGLQWNLSRHWSTDFMYVYQYGNDMLTNLQTIRVGLNYYI